MKKDIFQLIARHSCELIQNLEGHELKPEDPLEDLGAHSVDRAEIIIMTLEAFSLQIPCVELFGTTN